MSFLNKLFGGGEASAPKTAGEEHNGFTIYPQPVKSAGGFRVGARIEKDGQVHEMVRADVVATEEEARTTSLLKAKMLVDQQGDTIF
ncbi:MAG: HlyU family transcriptional regulator [Pseudomonadota bacterium]